MGRGRIVVLLGGTSAEREVSLASGRACADALVESGYDVVEIDPNCGLPDFVARVSDARPDKVFNALHGCPGEDGVIQAVLDWLGIPYTHSGVSASAIAMHKGLARSVFADRGIPIAEGFSLTREEFSSRIVGGELLMELPFVVKPLCEGSSVGVHVVRDVSQLERIESDWVYGDILIEEYIGGRELTVSVLGDRSLEVTDLVAEGEFYDFTAKYTDGRTRHICPAEISDSLRSDCMRYALEAHNALGCRGVSRSDFRYDGDSDRLVILEVNTQPGMTSLSLVPEQARICGMSFIDLCEWIVEYG